MKTRLIKLRYNKKYQRLLSEVTCTSGLKCGHVILNPGEGIGEHTTEKCEEIIIILKGKGEAKIDKEGFLK